MKFTFTNLLDSRQLFPSDNYLILKDYVYWNERYRLAIKIKKGFICDGCSMPLIIRSFVRATQNRTDIIWPIHDCLYRNKYDKHISDNILDDMLQIDDMNISWYARNKVYFGLKLFGSSSTDQEMINNAITYTEILECVDYTEDMEIIAIELLH